MTETSVANFPEESLAGADTAQRAVRRIATIALLAVAVGFLAQALILAGKLAGGASWPGIALFADLAQGVTWSALVCAGVGIGTSLGKQRMVLAGIFSAICAPIAIALAKAAQRVMASLIEVAVNPAILSLATIGALRAVQYGILGWLLAWLVQKGETRPLPYVGSGAAVGVTIGGTIMFISARIASQSGLVFAAPQMVASIVNEILFPIGCAAVIYVGQFVGRNLKIIAAAEG
jgi:hypothetical protein